MIKKRRQTERFVCILLLCTEKRRCPVDISLIHDNRFVYETGKGASGAGTTAPGTGAAGSSTGTITAVPMPFASN